MNPHTTQPVNARAFTLTELLVAIGVVSLLTAAAGQLFRTMGNVVSTGTAISTVDQMARTIERQLRDDIDALNLMAPDETFIAIRMREVGDVNRNGEVDDGETALYLRPEDRDADLEDGLDPYETIGSLKSRAVTRRIDELMFISRARNAEGYTSYQIDKVKTSEGDPADLAANLVGVVNASTARIYWGHGLLPAIGDDNEDGFPQRRYVPDGLTTADDPWGAAFGSRGRNEFASDFVLARQPLLLFGGDVAGLGERRDPSASFYPAGASREFAPYIRDLETANRFRAIKRLFTNTGIEGPDDNDLFNEFRTADFSEERPITWGRVDLCAQSPTDVRSWLEGANVDWKEGQQTSFEALQDGAPFSTGALLDEDDGRLSAGDINAPLWRRWGMDIPPAINNDLNDSLNLNLQGLRSAIAGCFFRPLVEVQPPIIDTHPDDPHRQPHDALMDAHATFASSCSNFEIAWSDGSVALDDIEVDGDDIPEIYAGDLLWFDIRTLDQTDPDTRATRTWFQQEFRSGREVLYALYNGSRGTPPANAPFHTDNLIFDADFPEVTFDNLRSTSNSPPTLINRDERPINEVIDLAPAEDFSETPLYNPNITGGAPDQPGSRQDEYFAIWPFRIPDQEGAFSDDRPWPKDILIRIRLTLHDPQNRLENGRDYEFIYRINPAGQ